MLIIVPSIDPANVKIRWMFGQKIDAVYANKTKNVLQKIYLKIYRQLNSSWLLLSAELLPL